MIRLLFLLSGISLCLGGCALNSTTLDASATLVNSLAAAGCSGTLDLANNATTAAAGIPSAAISGSFHGTCTPVKTASIVPTNVVPLTAVAN